MNQYSRRNFIRLSAISAAFLGSKPGQLISTAEAHDLLEQKLDSPPALGKTVMGLKKAPINQVKVGFIGVGNRGSFHTSLIQALSPKAKITAVCDIRPAQAQKVADKLKQNGQTPRIYSGSANAWKEMIRQDDLDLIIIATPWEDHAPMAVAAMQAGKHVAIEVPAAVTLQECWDLVNTAEQTQLNCMMLENVCYGDEELWILNMVQNGVFGTLTYGEAAYIHDLKEALFKKDSYYNDWRIRHNLANDGNLYPTHGLGPVAQYMNIGRGDRFDYLVSMSSPQASMTEYSLEVNSDNEFYNRSDFKHGDMNNTLIKTAVGRSILVQHDVVTPRVYSRKNVLAGTKAYHEGYPSRFAMKGKGHEWVEGEELKKMQETYKHPIWNQLKAEIEKNGGHGGMDFVMMYRLIDCLNRGVALDMDVYDGADWSVVTALSQVSLDLGSVPVRFPDFTRGRWKGPRKLGIMEAV